MTPEFEVRVDNQLYSSSDSKVILRAGQSIDLKCTAKGGNPEPQLTITKKAKNGDFFRLGSKIGQNTYKYIVTQDDHDAILGCTAHNTVGENTDISEVKLNVLCE